VSCSEIHSSSVTGLLFTSLLDVHGPSITTDTACSSGLVVFDQGSCSCFFFHGKAVTNDSTIAVKYLQSGDGESAIVCAANTNLWCGIYFDDFPRLLTIILFLGLGHSGSPNSSN
jgi:hypothetical protein